MVGLVKPRSIKLTYVRSSSASPANCSCDRSLAILNAFKDLPNATETALLVRLMTSGVLVPVPETATATVSACAGLSLDLAFGLAGKMADGMDHMVPFCGMNNDGVYTTYNAAFTLHMFQILKYMWPFGLDTFVHTRNYS